MTTTGLASDMQPSQPGSVWVKACATLKSELGEATFGSWVAQASLLEEPNGALTLVTPTGIAADWIRRNAWRRIAEIWAENDPKGRRLNLKSKLELEASGRGAALRLATVDGRPQPADLSIAAEPEPA